jgi:hypothetical protein
MSKLLFLAGPLTGISYKEAVEWRQYVESKMPKDILAFSALRGKPHVVKETVLKDEYAGHPLSSSRGIITRDRNDVSRADAVLFNLLRAKRVSIGTTMELAWANLLRIPTIVVIEPGNIHMHAFVKETSDFVTDNLDEAIEIAVSVLETKVT